MKTGRIFFVLLLLAISSNGFAGGGTPSDPADDPPDCAWTPNDSFEPRARIPEGKYAGRCVDTRTIRSLYRLSPEETAAYGADGDILIANFLHMDRFWIARIPGSDVGRIDVEEVIFLAEDLQFANMGHMMIRFILSEDSAIQLIPQTDDLPNEIVWVRDITYSSEAVGVAGMKWDPVKGVLNQFVSADRFLSTEQKITEIKAGRRVTQFPLRLLPEDRLLVITNGVGISRRKGMEEMYHTLKRSCATEAFLVLDTILDYSKYEGRKEGHAWDARVSNIRHMLSARGILAENLESYPDLSL